MVQKLCVACNRRVALKCRFCDCGHVFSDKDMVIVENRRKVESETLQWDTWRLRRLKDARVRVARKPIIVKKKKKVTHHVQDDGHQQPSRRKLYDANNNNSHCKAAPALSHIRESKRFPHDGDCEEFKQHEDRIWKDRTKEMAAALAEINRRLVSQQSIWSQLNLADV